MVHPFVGSDHHLTFFARGIHYDHSHKYVYTRNFHSDLTDDVLSSIDWSRLVDFDDVDACVECVTTVITDVMDLLFPVKWFRTKKVTLPWSPTPEQEMSGSQKVKPIA